MRAMVENIKEFTILLWKLKGIREGFFIQVTSEIENISKQITGWQKYSSAGKEGAISKK